MKRWMWLDVPASIAAALGATGSWVWLMGKILLLSSAPSTVAVASWVLLLIVVTWAWIVTLGYCGFTLDKLIKGGFDREQS